MVTEKTAFYTKMCFIFIAGYFLLAFEIRLNIKFSGGQYVFIITEPDFGQDAAVVIAHGKPHHAKTAYGKRGKRRI